MSRLLGQVYKAHSDKYVIKCDNKLIDCRARGVLKIKSDGICVGDFVEVEDKTIFLVQKRKNKFIRPNVSNVDIVVIVISPEPKPDFLLIDKLLLNIYKEDVKPIMVVNKTDINSSLVDTIRQEYKELNIETIDVSVTVNKGIERLKSILKGKLSVLAGQSAVGKTSIINAMFNLNLKTGDLSEKILRGKHTTTRSEIYEYDGIKLIDSPGFAVIDAAVELNQLPLCYPEYYNLSNRCRFRGCTHISEPNCAVKEEVEKGLLSQKRYERYIEIYNEILKRRKSYEKN